SVHGPPSKRQSNVEPDSVASNKKLAGGSVAMPEGPAVIELSGGVVSPWSTATVQRRCAGVRSVLPDPSVARTEEVWTPSARPAYVCGESQWLQALPSRRHSNVEFASLDANEKLAVPFATVPIGPVVIV